MRRIKLLQGDNLESVVYTLMAARARGESVYAEIDGHKLYSKDVDMDSAFMEVTGHDKAAYDREQEKKRHEDYAEMIKSDRAAKGKRKVTPELVVAGLKYIAENQTINQYELINGLLALGCNFTHEDICHQFPEEAKELIPFNDGMRAAETPYGAIVLVDIRDTELGRDYYSNQYLSVDDDYSIYHFIRMWGDNSYTKELIEKMTTE